MRASEFITERKKKKSARSMRGYFFPGYAYYGAGDSGEGSGDGGGDGGGESVNRSMAERKQSPLEDFEGLQFRMVNDNDQLFVNAFDSSGSNELGHVTFDIGDGKELDPQNLYVKHKFRSQGIARLMYDFVKSKGYKIQRSWEQTDAGAGFWDKHRGEERVWEQGVAEGKLNFEEGDCPIFAIALHRLSKMPLMALVEYDDQMGSTVLIHAYVKLTDRWRLDASGETDVDWMLQRYPNNGHAEEIEISEKDLLELGYGKSKCPTLQQVLPHAKEVLQNIEEVQPGVAENFADGRNPQDKGDSVRHGIPKKATMAELEKASHAKGRKGQLARWQLNMRRGKKK